MTASLTSRTGTPIQLGAVLASAGEGVIHEVAGRPDLVAKVFHTDLKDLAAKLAKVGAMILTPPDGTVQSDGFVVLTWPTDLLDGHDGTVGYLMPRIDTSNAVEIHTVSNPANRSNPLPSAPQWTRNVTWLHLVNIAANLCLAVETVHRVDAVIGDFQERNILVNDTTRVTLVDCDSMQFTDSAGHRYLCALGRPEFTAPELARANLAVTARDKPSDLFALAVHIHLLLMAGNHPFLRGEWTGVGEQPDALTLAASGQWAGGPGSALLTHALAPPISFLPLDIQRLFIRAFTDGARNPAARPTAAEWRAALSGMQLGTCARGHQIPVEADPCPWCVIEDQRAARRTARVPVAPAYATSNQVAVTIGAPALASTAPSTSTFVQSAPILPAAHTNRRALLGVVAALSALVVVLLGVVIYFATDDGPSPNTRTASPSPSTFDADPAYGGTSTTTTIPTQRPVVAPARPPADAMPCGPDGPGLYPHAARGTEITSCPFAVSVRDAVNATGQPGPSMINAYSPVTQKWYPMTCRTEAVLTCRGGNDAVVYVY